ncbi:trypsin-like peptidase domain-containing protein [Treponema parvum]|uniref:Trypsin-like peptidase domain-containing protein n=1 Tax=Treponema parvum TaxID=138851 RepID=A0A975F4M8_9SPIR|nr:trypsin-like peptidase domain-containing protein [Treponema parvum]QTQ14320.1 trypsin-like peptidase domain-containing protein [Treponema parvum]
MLNKKNSLLFFFFSALTAFAPALFSGCASNLNRSGNVYEVPDYSIEDIRNIEINDIKKILETKPVLALWRSYLIDDRELTALCFERIAELYKSAAQKKDHFTALRLYRSLDAAGYPEISSLNTSLSELESLCCEGVPGVQTGAADRADNSDSGKGTPENVAQYISGTVTVWIDQGIKIERGVGYADRVIGSGFFIRKDGYIVTNYHVIKNVVDTKFEGVARLYVRLADDPETRVPAKVVGWDATLDLALLKTEVDAPYVFRLGSSSGLSVGDRIFAIGSPVGLDRTLTSGIVSAMNRKLFTTGSVFQIDAAVNGGNSGGPCIDVNGNVQAIVFAGLPQYQGLNFAIPVEYLKTDLPMLFNGGKREHAWIGAYGHTFRNGTVSEGLEIQYVMSSGSAQRSYLKTGQIITAVNGKKVFDLDSVQDELRRFVPDTLARFSYTEDGSEKETLVYLDVRPEYPGKNAYERDLIETSFVPLFGMGLQAVSSLNSRKYAVTKIIKGGIADESGFSENDPVDIGRIKFSDDNAFLSAEIYARKRKKGYLDIGVSITTPLDSPYYF